MTKQGRRIKWQQCVVQYWRHSQPSSLSPQLLFSLGIPVAGVRLCFKLYSAVSIKITHCKTVHTFEQTTMTLPFRFKYTADLKVRYLRILIRLPFGVTSIH